MFCLRERERERERDDYVPMLAVFHTRLLFFAKGNCACSIYPFFILLSF